MPVPPLWVIPAIFGALLVVCVGFGVAIGRVNRKLTKREFAAPGLFGVVGRMGGGKTYFMAAAAADARAHRRPVYANFAVEGAEYVGSWAEVVSVPKKAMVLVDEMPLWWPSNAWRVPPDVRAWCGQLRKLEITMLWTAQHHSHVGKRLLQLSFGIWHVTNQRGLHTYTLFDPADIDRANREPRGRMRLKRERAIEASYDTLEIIEGACTWEPGAVPEARRAAPSSTARLHAVPRTLGNVN